MQEYNQDTSPTLEESNGQKRWYIEGIFLQADIRNKNGRIYPGHVMEEAVDSYIETYINTNKAGGELNHPHPPRANINGKEICIKFESLTRVGSNWEGKALVTNTRNGREVAGLLGDGYNLGISSRALASTKVENSTHIVQNGMKLCTAGDIVTDPSAPEAFVNGVMEGNEWIYEDGIYRPKDLHDARKIVLEAKKKDLPAAYKKVFQMLVQKRNF